MRLPGFTAQSSLSEISRHHRMAWSATQADGAIVLAKPPPIPDCYFWCMFNAKRQCQGICPSHGIDCYPRCLARASAQCAKLCHGTW